MINREVFKIWAPAGIRWTEWVRPVLFIPIDEQVYADSFINLSLPEINYIKKPEYDTAVIADLPGYEGITEGLALAKLGFRPIPIYNGVFEQIGSTALVNNRPIIVALAWGSSVLKTIEIAADAPPVFLLDSNRVHWHKRNISVFDNSWDIYEQDTPSAEYFIKTGITRIIVRGYSLQKDLALILHKYQKAGMSIFFTDGLRDPKEIKVRKPRQIL